MKAKLLLFFLFLMSITLQAATPWDGTTVATSYAGGTGISTDPFQISTPAELAFLSQNVNAGTTYAGVYFILHNDIDLNNKAWTPIGNSDTNSFRGRFNGNSHLIFNLTINLPTTTGVGLFGYIQNAFIYNLGIVGQSSVTGLGSVGGIVGRCYVTSIVTGNSIKGCFCNATVTAVGDCVGGIVGIFRATNSRVYLIDNCYSTGNITGNNYAAGIVGKVELPALTISNSYSCGVITTTVNGGINGGIATTITGGLPTLTNCYYINGDPVNANGAFAKMASEMQAPAFVTILNGTQSPVAWQADFAGGNSVNSGFPIFVWRKVTTDISNTLISPVRVVVIGKTVKIEAPYDITKVQLYNINGQLVESKNICNQTKSMSIELQQAGVYLLIVYTLEGKLSHKFVIL